MNTAAVFINFFPSAVAHYRSMIPARSLGASMYVRNQADYSKAKIVGKVDQPVVIYSMPRNEAMFDECFDAMALNGKALIIDIDDSLRAVVEAGDHPHWKEFEKHLAMHETFIAEADAVTASTEYLKQYAIRCGAKPENVFVVPNAIDLDRFNIKKEPKHKENLMVGWSRAAAHDTAAAEYASAFTQLLEDEPSIVLVGLGEPLAPLITNPKLLHRVADLGYTSMTQHPHTLAQLHINVGPAVDSPVYRGKSPIRALEAFASDAAFVGHRLVYDEVVNDGENGLLFDSPLGMVSSVKMLAAMPRLGFTMRSKASQSVKAYAEGSTNARWLSAINHAAASI